MAQTTPGSNALSTFLANLPIGRKLAVGFGAVLLIMVVLVTYLTVELKNEDVMIKRIVELRMPTNVAGLGLVNGVNHSLAALRGYMILNKDSMKQARQKAWKNIDSNLDIMTEMSKNWTVPKNIEDLKELKSIFAEFKIAQQKVEDISHTIDEQPAMKILLTEAAPRANKILIAITAMINEEKKQPATAARKALLATLADSRGSFAVGLASIRAFLLSGDKKWADDFNKRWQVNTARFKTIQKNRGILTTTQKRNFDTYASMRGEFAPLPAKMFEIRGSKKWNMANYLLGTEAAPRAGKAMKILEGMVANQGKLVADDAHALEEQSTFMQTMLIMGTLIALVLAGFIGWIITRMIANPLSEAMSAANRISEGDLSGQIVVASTDEVGQLLQSLKQMQTKLTQVIEKDIQTIVDAAREGDLSQRVDMQGKAGFYEKLSHGVNDVVENGENIVKDTIRVFSALSEGDLSVTIDTEYKGEFNRLKQNANTTIEKITQVIEKDIQLIIDAAYNGDLTKRIDLAGKEGFFKKMSEGINQMIQVVGESFDDVGRVMEAMSKGDLTQKITEDYAGVYGDVKDNINTTIGRLEEALGKIKESSEFIRNSSEEISAGNNNLSQRAEEQASTLEETASSMEELTSTVKNNADNAVQASQLAIGTRDLAEKGGNVVKEAVDAMNEITASSNKIAEIIGVIDEIAFQTNLLALNASVEAARAGEQGRGFAVVATEVRNLAQRSATAAKEIKDLISDSGKKVDAGGKLVNESGETLSEIVDSVKKVGDIISEIAAASQEQSAGIEQVNKAVTQMDEITQQNAALAEEASASSESSLHKATEMNSLVSFFKMDHSVTAAAYSPEIQHAPAPTREMPARKSAPQASLDDDEWEEF